VARKLGNFGSSDPLLAQRGISGLSHASKLDKQIWDEFSEQWDSLVRETGQLLNLKQADLVEPSEEAPIISRPEGPTDKKTASVFAQHTIELSTAGSWA
jgi:putative restriction endonuclease